MNDSGAEVKRVKTWGERQRTEEGHGTGERRACTREKRGEGKKEEREGRHERCILL